MNTVIVIQARLTSQRLPGKVLKLIGNEPALGHTFVRAQHTGFRTVLAVPESQLSEFHHPWYDWMCYGGSQDDVLARFTSAAMQEQANIVVRITGDCPFVDPRMVWACAYEAAKSNGYCCNCGLGDHPRTEPRGLDVEAFPLWALVEADLHASTSYEREHVTPWIREHVAGSILPATTNRPDLRWVLDTQEDYDWFCRLATMIDCTPPHPTTRELLTFLKDHPEMERRDG